MERERKKSAAVLKSLSIIYALNNSEVRYLLGGTLWPLCAFLIKTKDGNEENEMSIESAVKGHIPVQGG